MSELKVCDRCGTFMEPKAQDRYGVRINSNKFMSKNPVREYDLCLRCFNKLCDWVGKENE
jgi:hypothetical protein